MKGKLLLAALCAGAMGALPAAAAADSSAVQAPESAVASAGAVTPDCTTPAPTVHYSYLHCYGPDQIRSAYGVDQLGDPTTGTGNLGAGQTIVLVDSYGSPTAAHDLQYFHDTYFPNLPSPNFSEVYPNGYLPDYANTTANGMSGPSAAAGWTGEATLDIEWAYSIAPRAHIILLAVPPAETEGVQGFPNLFKAISDEIAATPAGTEFSMSFGVDEPTFGGAGATQTAKFDSVFQQGIAKGDTFFASSGDNGSTGTSKQHKDTTTDSYPTVGWPASSPYVTGVGGTQLQYGWTWDPTSDTPFDTSGQYNPAYFGATSGGDQNVVWNESWAGIGTGGGESAIYPRPSYQSTVATGDGNHRLVPDVAWNAAVNGGVLVYITAYPSYQRPGWHLYGGTSAASPQLAGLTALAESARVAAGRSAGLGNIDPQLYAHPNWFTDVVPVKEGTAASGVLDNNQMWVTNADGSVSPGPVPGFPTTTGYDATTGLGTPWAPNYVTGLAGS